MKNFPSDIVPRHASVSGCKAPRQHVPLIYFESKMQQVTKQQTTTTLATIALGSNMASRFGPPDLTVATAISRIAGGIGPITGKSRLYVTPCFPAGSGPDFVNAVIMSRTSLTAGKVLQSLHDIEADFGRERTVRWGQRTLDLDLLCMESAVIPDEATQTTWRHFSRADQEIHAPEELILPHPRLQDRAFVLVPMADVAPDWVHPVIGQSVRQMLAGLPSDDVQAVVAIDPGQFEGKSS